MKDIALHAIAAFILTSVTLSNPAGLVVSVMIMWLLRELAQRDKSNLITAIKTMPQWSLSKHAEWLAPGMAAAAAVFVNAYFKGV